MAGGVSEALEILEGWLKGIEEPAGRPLLIHAADVQAVKTEVERLRGGVRVPVELAEWVYHLLCRRLETGHQGRYVLAWSETELGRRDKRWVEELAAALGRGEPTPPPTATAPPADR